MYEKDDFRHHGDPMGTEEHILARQPLLRGVRLW